MFNHILLPTDGSDLSRATVRRTMQFARDAGAKVTGIHVVPDFHVLSYRPDMVSYTEDQYRKDSEREAARFLEHVTRVAQEDGVPCETVIVHGDRPAEQILAQAEARGCDLICMASHGRMGVKDVLLGSETQKVLSHGKLPVLVFH